MYPREYGQFDERDWDDEDIDGTVSFAVVGLGGFTCEWVLPAIEDSEYAETSCLVSGDQSKAKELAIQAPIPETLTYDQYRKGEQSDAYDAVYIATPNATHLDLVEAAAEHGKDVLCEKPMEVSAERSEQMVAACEAADVSLMIAYRIHFEPAVRWARSLIEDGVIGDPVHVHGSMSQHLFETIGPDPDQWRLNHDMSGGAALIDLGIYPLNTTRFLLGTDPSSVDGTTRSPTEEFTDVDEHVSFTVEFEDGVLGSYSASQAAVRSSHLHVTGTGGELRLEPVFFGEIEATVRDGARETSVEFEQGNAIREEFDYFASRVLTDREIDPNGRHGLVDMEAIDGIYEAASEE
jgi:xylose dehydrogenase (NAD/NADP)